MATHSEEKNIEPKERSKFANVVKPLDGSGAGEQDLHQHVMLIRMESPTRRGRT